MAAGLPAAEPSLRQAPPPPRSIFERRAAEAGKCAAPETSKGEFSAFASVGNRDFIRKTMQHDGARCLRLRHDFEANLGERRQCAIGARLQLAHVVAGDVLDDLAARLPDFSEAVHGGKAKDVVPRRSRAHAPRSGQIAGDHAAQRLLALSAEKGAPVGRLEGQHLPLFRKLRIDRGERRPRSGGQDKFGGLVVNDVLRAAKRRERDRFSSVGQARASCRPRQFQASRPLRSPKRRPRPFAWRLTVASSDTSRSPQKRGRSGNATLPAWTCMRPSSAQRQSCGNTLPGLSRLSESKAHFSRIC